MRGILLHILFIIFCQNLFSQNSAKFDKIIFTYNYGNYVTNIPEIYETIEIELINSKKYKIRKYTLSKEIYNDKNNKSSTKNINTTQNQLIDFKSIENLIIELNTDRLNFTSILLQEKLLKPKKDLIGRMVKNSSSLNKIFNKNFSYTKKNESELLCLMYFEEFLKKEAPKEKTLYVMTDSWKDLTITTIKKTDTIKYKCITHHGIGQPIDIIQSNKTIRIVNLNVNKIILNILPKKSYFRKAFDYNNITEKYINWYLINKVQ